MCNTYRYHGHHVGDIDRSYYRSKEEEELWKTERDPLKTLGVWLVDRGLCDWETLGQIEADVTGEVKAGAEYAQQAAYPDESEVDKHVYA